MKNSAYFTTIAALLLLFLGSCSCSRNKSTQNNQSFNHSIVGEWVEYDPNDPYAEDYITSHFIFYANGTGYWKLMGDLYNPNAERGRGYFRWEQHGNTIGIFEEGDYYQLAYHGNELVRTGAIGVEIFRKKR